MKIGVLGVLVIARYGEVPVSSAVLAPGGVQWWAQPSSHSISSHSPVPFHPTLSYLFARAVCVIASPDSSAMSKGVNSNLYGEEINGSDYNKEKELQGASVYKDFTIQPYGAFCLYQMHFFPMQQMLPITTEIQPEICHKSFLNCSIFFSWKNSSRKSKDLKPNYFPLPKNTCTQSSTVLYILLIWCFLL